MHSTSNSFLKAVNTIIIFFCLVTSFTNAIAEQSQATIYPIQEDKYIFSPLGKYSFWFQTNPGTVIGDTNIIELVYTNSEMLIPELSFMTLLINDKPVSSVNINSKFPGITVWQISIPPGLIAPGFNEVTLSTLQRTIADPCQDLYNKSNWICIKSSSFFKTSFVKDSSFVISDFPYPFVNYLDRNSFTSNIVLPDISSNESIEAFLTLASYMGSIKPGNSVYFNINPESDSLNKIFIGTGNSLPQLSGINIPEKTGYMSFSNVENVSSFLISGRDNEGIKKSLNSLTNETLRNQIDTNETYISNYFRKENAFTANTIKLSDLGIKDIKIEGIFDQSEFLTIKRPVNLNIGPDTYIRINFRHSANLNPKQSILTALVNGKPAASVLLDQSNIDNGTFDIKIPMDQLNKTEWAIELVSYQDIGNLGQIDCSHLYNEAVWTYIDASNSEIVFTDGTISPQPSLDFFPYTISTFPADSGDVVVCLPENPNIELLELAGSVAARIGSSSGNTTNFTVVRGKPDENILKSAALVIYIGLSTDNMMWEGIRNSLFIKPDGVVSNEIELVNNNIGNSSVLQSIRSPWSNGIVYAIMVPGTEAIDIIKEKIVEEEHYSKITGQVAVINNADIISVSSNEVIEPQVEYNTFLSQVPSLYYYLLAAIAVLILIFTLMRVFKRKA